MLLAQKDLYEKLPELNPFVTFIGTKVRDMDFQGFSGVLLYAYWNYLI